MSTTKMIFYNPSVKVLLYPGHGKFEMFYKLSKPLNKWRRRSGLENLQTSSTLQNKSSSKWPTTTTGYFTILPWRFSLFQVMVCWNRFVACPSYWRSEEAKVVWKRYETSSMLQNKSSRIWLCTPGYFTIHPWRFFIQVTVCWRHFVADPSYWRSEEVAWRRNETSSTLQKKSSRKWPTTTG